MSAYRQGIFYGIFNPYGYNIYEGDHVEMEMKDGNTLCGDLIDASIENFIISNSDDEEVVCQYDDIKNIVFVESNE